MEPSGISEEELTCIICYEVPISIHESNCWGWILCEKCQKKLTKCPNRCKIGYRFQAHQSKFLQRKIDSITEDCPLCKKAIERKNLEDHKNNCPAIEKFHNPLLHPCQLIKTEKEGNWVWDGTKIIKGGCAKYGPRYKERTSKWFS